MAAAFQLLGEGEVKETQMLALVAEKDSFLGMVKFHHYLAQFIALGVIAIPINYEVQKFND